MLCTIRLFYLSGQHAKPHRAPCAKAPLPAAVTQSAVPAEGHHRTHTSLHDPVNEAQTPEKPGMPFARALILLSQAARAPVAVESNNKPTTSTKTPFNSSTDPVASGARASRLGREQVLDKLLLVDLAHRVARQLVDQPQLLRQLVAR